MLTLNDGASVNREPQVPSQWLFLRSLFILILVFLLCSSQRRRAQSTSKIVEKMKKRLAEQVIEETWFSFLSGRIYFGASRITQTTCLAFVELFLSIWKSYQQSTKCKMNLLLISALLMTKFMIQYETAASTFSSNLLINFFVL